MRNRKKRKQQGAFTKNLETMTLRRIESMSIFDSDKHIRLLQDPETGLFILFAGKYNQTFFSSSYQKMERLFNYLVSIS